MPCMSARSLTLDLAKVGHAFCHFVCAFIFGCNIVYIDYFLFCLGSRKQELDEAMVELIVKDSQPFTLVEDEGFRGFVNKLDPTYVLPTRQVCTCTEYLSIYMCTIYYFTAFIQYVILFLQALKAMVEQKFLKAKEEAKARVEEAAAVSLTADMWTSIHMDAYLAVTCHFINDSHTLSTVLLAVHKFPQAHTVANLAAAKASIMEEWGITSKVTCVVTDAAPNMIACTREMKVKHAICIAHAINLMVKKALDQTPGLPELRMKARKLVGLFRSSTTAKVCYIIFAVIIHTIIMY